MVRDAAFQANDMQAVTFFAPMVRRAGHIVRHADVRAAREGAPRRGSHRPFSSRGGCPSRGLLRRGTPGASPPSTGPRKRVHGGRSQVVNGPIGPGGWDRRLHPTLE